MNTTIIKTNCTSSASIIIQDSLIAKGIISIDLHTNNSLSDQASFECYEDLLLSGTNKKTRAEFLHGLSSLGGSITASVNAGTLTISVSSLASTWTKMLRLLEEMLTTPAFSQTEIKRVKTLIHNQLHDAKEDAKTIAHHNLVNNLYSDSDRRCTASIADLQTALAEVTQTNLNHIHTRIQSRNWVVSVVGSEATIKQFNTTISRLTTKVTLANKQTTTASTQSQKPARLLLDHIPSRQNIDLSIGCTLPLKPGHPDYPSLVFAIAVLAKWGGFAGRLMSTVREKEGLTYGIYGRMTGYDQVTDGYLWIMTFFSPQQLQQGITSTFREIKQLCEIGITAKEFAAFSTILETSRILQQDSPLAQVATLHHFNQLGFTTEDIESYHNSFKELTRVQVNQAITTYLDPESLTVSAAGPVQPISKQLQTLIRSL